MTDIELHNAVYNGKFITTAKGILDKVNTDKFREPCFIVIENNMKASVCFSARSSEKAAEAGGETLEDYRGKGYALRVASSWAKAIRHSRRIPLYSTSWDNYS